MTGYEFTRFEADFTSTMKAKAYDVNIVAMKCKEAFNKSGKKYWEEADYKDAEHWFIDTTMSCDMEEAINWMEYYMANAIAYGIQTKNLDWRTKFLAAWNIFKDLTKNA